MTASDPGQERRTGPGVSPLRPRTNPLARKRGKGKGKQNCAECRRLKLKCDRQEPCASCVRRKCVELCPSGVRAPRTKQDIEQEELRIRVDALESHIHLQGKRPSHTSLETVHHPIRSPPGSTAWPAEKPEATVTRDSNISTSAPGELHWPDAVLPNSALPSAESAQMTPPTGRSPHRPTNNVHFDLSAARVDHGITPISSDLAASLGSLDGFAGPSSIDLLPRPSSSHAPEPPHSQFFQEAPDQSHGTLLLGQGGSSRYYGHTAGPEWLKDQEEQENGETPAVSRIPSPQRPPFIDLPQASATSSFPFHISRGGVSSATLLGRLPRNDDAMFLVNSYYRYFSWHYDIITRPNFQKIYDRFYGGSLDAPTRAEMAKSLPDVGARGDMQALGLLFIVLGVGALYNLELAPNDPSAEEYGSLAKAALAKGDLLTRPTLAGLQALHIMAHFNLETDKGRNGDAAWPLWGLSIRLIEAMGLHRDGARWRLDPDVAEERRRAFWECQSADIFQSHCFSRPNSLATRYADTAFPTEAPELVVTGEKSFSTLKFELSLISAEVLDVAMSIDQPSYAVVMILHEKLTAFEKSISYSLRCRTALQALPSVYPDPNEAVRESPALSKNDIHRTFQQHVLSINVSEALLFLHRPYFAKALHDTNVDSIRSEFAPSLLTVVERCNAIIQCVVSLHAAHGNVSTRHWNLWYHAFNSAICMGTLILTRPHNTLAHFAMRQIEACVHVYTSALQCGGMAKMARNLQWLLRLRSRAANALQTAQAHPTDQTGQSIPSPGMSDNDAELIGWRTRLIMRAAEGSLVASNISQQIPAISNLTPISPQSATGNDGILLALQKYLEVDAPTAEGQSSLLGFATEQSQADSSSWTDDLLQMFWDPMMTQDVRSEVPETHTVSFFESDAITQQS